MLGLQNHKTKQVKPLKLDLDEFVVKIASGTDHLVLLSRHGVAFTFGSGGCGQLGRGGRYFSDRGGRRGTEYVLKPAPVRFSVSRNKKVFNGDTTSYLDASGFPSPSGFTKPHSNKTFVEDIFAAGMATFIVCAGQVSIRFYRVVLFRGFSGTFFVGIFRIAFLKIFVHQSLNTFCLNFRSTPSASTTTNN